MISRFISSASQHIHFVEYFEPLFRSRITNSSEPPLKKRGEIDTYKVYSNTAANQMSLQRVSDVHEQINETSTVPNNYLANPQPRECI